MYLVWFFHYITLCLLKFQRDPKGWHGTESFTDLVVPASREAQAPHALSPNNLRPRFVKLLTLKTM